MFEEVERKLTGEFGGPCKNVCPNCGIPCHNSAHWDTDLCGHISSDGCGRTTWKGSEIIYCSNPQFVRKTMGDTIRFSMTGKIINDLILHHWNDGHYKTALEALAALPDLTVRQALLILEGKATLNGDTNSGIVFEMV